ncbi:MAG: acyl-CoA dehydratase activase-related protein [Prevotella sp.]|jgi:predicted CoA-substrate-specific enzyme activase
MEDIYYVGLDVGSTTAKIAVLDAAGNLVYSKYERHHTHVKELVDSYFADLDRLYGREHLRLCVTGSVGMATAEELHAEFVQEVVAATIYARKRHPEARALIDIGGEDAKVVFFHGQATELRMNGNCAGGTGAFIDQMSVLMGCDNQHMNDLALQADQIYPMAARCGVFAKTDVQNLMARNLPENNIAASIFHSIAVQTVTTLSHGCDFEPPILLCGGPLTFLPALRKAFAEYLHLQEKDFIIVKESNLIPAMGCALRAAEGKTDQKQQNAGMEASATVDGTKTAKAPAALPSLFKDAADHEEWTKRKQRYATPIHELRPGNEEVVIGIDSGSTTTKVIAVRAKGKEKGEIVFTHYGMNSGNPIQAAADGIRALKEQAERTGTQLSIVGSCSTGYGEELIKKAFGLDEGIIETMAHYRAAVQLMPNVSFILDIGGQDMKAIFVDHGAVVRMELNEACSSGCGTFIQTFAKSMGYRVEDYAALACNAQHPCDLGTRCTVFMNSKVKQVLREGVKEEDIAAGLSFSVVRNCLYKVLKLRGNDSLGKHIVVQGGTMKNDSVVRAFELLSGTEVARSNIPEMMGAYGCALYAAEHLSAAVNVDSMLQRCHYDTRELHCHGCENQCLVTKYDFGDKRVYYSGNKCERVFNNKGRDAVQGENIYGYKYHQLFDRAKKEADGQRDLRGNAPKQTVKAGQKAKRGVVGIPRVLNMYEEFPFWHTLFTAAGFDVMLSSESNFRAYEQAVSTVMSDNICFPAKLVHAHIKELDERLHNNPDAFIFMPYVIFERKEDNRTVNSYNCPVVSGYSDVVRSAIAPKTRLDSPVINFADEKLLRKQISDYMHTLGVKRQVTNAAMDKAIEVQRQYELDMKQHCEEILEHSRQQHRLTILLAGRPYHTDPLIQHKLSEMIAGLGVNVISDDIVRGDLKTGTGDTYLVKQWAYMNRIIKSGQWAAEQPDDIHFVQMTSFGCGPDAFIQDEIRDILRAHHKPFTLLKIDDVSNTGSLKLRVRSLIESLKQKKTLSADSTDETNVEASEQLSGADTEKQNRNAKETAANGTVSPMRRHILAPYFTEYLTPLLPPLTRLIGFDVEIMPPSDPESAELGLQYANNEICYPATLIVGDVVKALKSGRYDLKNTSVVMSQTGGQCRATNYAALIKKAMIANGFGDVPLITLGVSTNAKEDDQQNGALDVPWFKMAPIITTTLLYGDTISKMFHASVVREKAGCEGKATELRDKYLNLASDPILANNPKGLMDLISKAAAEFDEITADKALPAVGIVGEIFLKFNPFAHQFLARRIIERGIEVVPPLLSPFFLQDFVNLILQKHLGLKRTHVPDFVVRSLYTLIWRRQQKINKIASRFRYFRPFTNIFEEAREVQGIVSYAAQFGEGWLLPSDIVSFVHQGVNNVASLQPFGCIANHIISKGIEKKLKKMFPQLNLVSLDFDAGVSAVNVTNRLLLFLDGIESAEQPVNVPVNTQNTVLRT